MTVARCNKKRIKQTIIIISKWLERNGVVKDVRTCLDYCFKGKCWYNLKVISFLYIPVILTFD